MGAEDGDGFIHQLFVEFHRAGQSFRTTGTDSVFYYEKIVWSCDFFFLWSVRELSTSHFHHRQMVTAVCGVYSIRSLIPVYKLANQASCACVCARGTELPFSNFLIFVRVSFLKTCF